MKRIVKIEPYFEPRVWGGGTRLIEEFHYRTNIAPIGEAYCVVALPGHADCAVPDMNMTLSQLYTCYPEWFDCETEELPIKVNIIDPNTGKTRPIHPKEVYDNVNLPDKLIEFEDYPSSEELGCLVTRYWDEPGLYTLIRLKVKEKGQFLHERFAFYTCIKGEGTLNGIKVRQGDTFLVPDRMGWINIEGDLDLFLASYRNKNVEY